MVALRLLLLVSAATLAVGHDDGLRRQLRKKRSLPCNPKKDMSCCLDKLRTKRPRTEEETRETRLEIAIACV